MKQLSATLFSIALLAFPLSAAEPTHAHSATHDAPLHTFKSNSPDALWDALMAGNKRYVGGDLSFHTLRERRDATRAHQDPPVAILSCADSRVPPELIFDHTVGDLFVVRVAGNVAEPLNIASLEFAIANDYTNLIVVMGHEACGAVKAALAPTDPPTPNLVALVTKIRESFTGADRSDVRAAVEANARHTAEDLMARSDVIRNAVQNGTVKIVPAYYAFDGTVTRLDHPAHH